MRRKARAHHGTVEDIRRKILDILGRQIHIKVDREGISDAGAYSRSDSLVGIVDPGHRATRTPSNHVCMGATRDHQK